MLLDVAKHVSLEVGVRGLSPEVGGEAKRPGCRC